MTNGGPRLGLVGWMERRLDWLLLGRSMKGMIETRLEGRLGSYFISEYHVRFFDHLLCPPVYLYAQCIA